MDYKTIFFTAIITSAAGLAGSHLYSKMVTKEEIKILPSSFGFYTPDNLLIDVPSELIQLTKDSHIKRLEEKTSYKELEEMRNYAIKEIKMMEQGISLCEKWLMHHSVDIEKGEDDINHQLKRSAILEHPIFHPSQEFLGMTILKLRRGNLEL